MLAELRFAHLADVTHGRIAFVGHRRANQQRDPHARGPELAVAEQQPSQFGDRQVIDRHPGIDDDGHVSARGLTLGPHRSAAHERQRYEAHGDC
jgi:hypothetical protein